MRIEFKEQFALPIDEVFSFFRTPPDWVRLYGFGGPARALGDGWYAVPLKHFPFPLVVRVVACHENEFVCWTYRGFWRGYGEVRFSGRDGLVAVEGCEQIAVRWLFGLSPMVERWFFERPFREVWARGWRMLHTPRTPCIPALAVNDQSGRGDSVRPVAPI